jgi:hypothetical protein
MFDGARRSKLYRGSARRVRRITIRGNWSADVLILIACVLFCLLVVVPWLVRHPSP